VFVMVCNDEAGQEWLVASYSASVCNTVINLNRARGGRRIENANIDIVAGVET
jgi:hypothetical protein